MAFLKIAEDIIFPEPKDDHERDILNSIRDSYVAISSAINALTEFVPTTPTLIEDDDQNTGWEAERTSDDNILYGKTAGTDAMVISAAGLITKPLHPVFMAEVSAAQNDFSVNTLHTPVYGTVHKNVGSHFDGTSTFTAPVTGTYCIHFSVRLTNLDTTATELLVSLVTNNRTYTVNELALWASAPGNNGPSIGATLVVDMDAGHTAVVNFKQNGGATPGTDMVAGNFQGFLIG